MILPEYTFMVFVHITFTFILLCLCTLKLFHCICVHKIYSIVLIQSIDVTEYTGDGGLSHSDDVEECIDRYFAKIVKVKRFPGMHVLHLYKFITWA